MIQKKSKIKILKVVKNLVKTSPKNNAKKMFQKMYPNFRSQKGGNEHNRVFEQTYPFLNSVRRTPAPPTQHQPPQKSRLSQFSFFTVEVVFVFGLHRLTSVSCGKKALRLGHSRTQCFVYISTL